MVVEQQVEARINIRTILQKSPETAKHMVTEARKVLESWHATYMDVRHRIEESGTDHRWEFDRKRLFEQTNYMARVCGDLLEVKMQPARSVQPERQELGEFQHLVSLPNYRENIVTKFHNN